MSPLRYECVNPLEYGAAIKALFSREGEPQFAAYFDRVYPSEVEAGGRSWVAFAPDGELVLHVARFLYEFMVQGRARTGGLTANLMVATRYRTLVPAVSLMRRVVADDSAGARVDFLYTTTTAQTVPVLKLAGFDELATVARYVLPLGDRNPLLDAGIRVRNSLQRRGVGRPIGGWKEYAGEAFPMERFATCVDEASLSPLSPLRTERTFRRRLPGFPSGSDLAWLEEEPAGGERLVAVRVEADGKRGDVTAISPAAARNFAHFIPTVAQQLRARGLTRLYLHAIEGSTLAVEAVRAGFVRRRDRSPFMAVPLRPDAAQLLALPGRWAVCGVDFDGLAA